MLRAENQSFLLVHGHSLVLHSHGFDVQKLDQEPRVSSLCICRGRCLGRLLRHAFRTQLCELIAGDCGEFAA